MPSIGFGEIVIVLLFALIIFGPKRLPEMGRTVGRGLKEFRKAAADLRQELETDEIRKDLESGLEETPKASVEERTARLTEPQQTEPEPPKGAAPPT
ncbi:MAG: Sec-independent protein translocase protein TatB [Actinomycetota bacterium]